MCYDTINESISLQIVDSFTIWIKNNCRLGQLTSQNCWVSGHLGTRYLELMFKFFSAREMQFP